MKDKIKEISNWLFEQGIGLTRDIIDEKLREAYKQGQIDSYLEVVDTTIDNILLNTMNEVSRRKKELYEKNFYTVPSEDDVIQMKAYEFLTDNFPQIVKEYRGS